MRLQGLFPFIFPNLSQSDIYFRLSDFSLGMLLRGGIGRSGHQIYLFSHVSVLYLIPFMLILHLLIGPS